MVDREIVLETVKKMYESGIEDQVVRQTLKDIGLTPEEANKCIAEAKGSAAPSSSYSVAKPQFQEPKPLQERLAAAEEKPDQAAMHTTTHVALEAQSAKTSELLEKMNSLEEKLEHASASKAMPQSLASANQRLALIEKQLRDLKAELTATKAIMEKILETDRKVLNRL